MEEEVTELREKDGGTMNFPARALRSTGSALLLLPGGLGHQVCTQVSSRGCLRSKNVDTPVWWSSRASFCRPYEMTAGGIFDYLSHDWPHSFSQIIDLQTVLGKQNLATGGFKATECLIVFELCEGNDIEWMWKTEFRCTHTFCLSRSRLWLSVLALAAVPLICSEHHLE